MNEEMLKKLAGGGKSPEEVLAIAKNGELSDEALDKVAGGGWEWLWESSSPRVTPCGICHKSDESVAPIILYTIDFGNGCSSGMYLCSKCVTDERKKYKVTEGWGGK